MIFRLSNSFNRIRRFHNKKKRLNPYYVIYRSFTLNKTFFRGELSNITKPNIPSNLHIYPMLKLMEKYA